MRKDVREFIRRLEAVGLTVESTPEHYRVLRDGEPLRKANGMPFTLPFSPDTVRWRTAAIVELMSISRGADLVVVVDQLERVAVGERATEVVWERESDAADGVETLRFGLGQLEVETGEAVFDLGACSCAEDWDDHAPFLLSTHPGDRDLRRCRAALGRDRVEFVGDHEVRS
jgi:hypothetical protein